MCDKDERFEFGFEYDPPQAIENDENDTSNGAIFKQYMPGWEKSQMMKRSSGGQVEFVISPSQQVEAKLEDVTINDKLTFKKVVIGSAEQAQLLNLEDVEHKDVITGQYEGGFKLWEGSIDLARFLHQQWVGDLELKDVMWTQLAGKKVLELGCGHGLPGILTGLLGGQVYFQDYNKDVLSQVTQRNVSTNQSTLGDQYTRMDAKYICGPWSSIPDFLNHQKLAGCVDIILASEVTYNTDYLDDLVNCIISSLKPPKGVAYIASKSHYFGVGGGVAELKAAVERAGMLSFSRVSKISDDTSTGREIIKLSFPESISPYFM